MRRFKYTPRESHYDEILAPGKSDYEYDPDGLVNIRVLKNFFDLERDSMSLQGERYDVTRSRAKHLEELKLVETME